MGNEGKINRSRTGIESSDLYHSMEKHKFFLRHCKSSADVNAGSKRFLLQFVLCKFGSEVSHDVFRKEGGLVPLIRNSRRLFIAVLRSAV